MAALDWSQCAVVESVPGKVSGAWVFRDTRMPVSIVFENIESGASIEEISEWFHIAPEKIQAVLEFAARSLDPPAATHLGSGHEQQEGHARLFDQNIPAPLRSHLKDHTVVEARERGMGPAYQR